jgi:dipeptidyl aminopeptidase/acylaminoacyl peptidase
VVAIIGLLLYGLVSWFVYDQVGKAPQACWPESQANTPAAWTVPQGWDSTLPAQYPMPEFQDIRFASRDPAIAGKELAAWWIPASAASPAEAPAVVLVHGIQSCRREASVLLAAGMLHRAGFSVFLMDLRDHGDSEGDDARFAGGSEEYLDVLGGWDWVRAQGVPESRIGLLGMSFGSITALLAGGEDERVAAVWADSAPPRIDEAIGLFVADQLHDSTGLSKALVPGALIWARLLAGDDLAKFNPIDEVARYGGRHVAFVHGADDAVLPATFALELHDQAVAAGAVTPDAWVVPNAGHTQGVFADPAGYQERLVAFFTAALGEP